MKVQILSEDGRVVWSHDATAPIDKNGNAWRGGNHNLMAAVMFSLNRALEQAQELPTEKNWQWPFDLSSTSENSFQQAARRIAFEVPPQAECGLCKERRRCRSNSNDQSCGTPKNRIVFVVLP